MIAKLVAVSELTIGALLILGLFTGAVAFAGLALNVIYMFSGTSGVNPACAIVAVFLVLAWRNAGAAQPAPPAQSAPDAAPDTTTQPHAARP